MYSPLSSTFVLTSGYVRVTLRSASTITGSSLGLRGSIASFISACVLNSSGLKIAASAALRLITVAVPCTALPSPRSSTQLPARACVTSRL